MPGSKRCDWVYKEPRVPPVDKGDQKEMLEVMVRLGLKEQPVYREQKEQGVATGLHGANWSLKEHTGVPLVDREQKEMLEVMVRLGLKEPTGSTGATGLARRNRSKRKIMVRLDLQGATEMLEVHWCHRDLKEPPEQGLRQVYMEVTGSQGAYRSSTGGQGAKGNAGSNGATGSQGATGSTRWNRSESR